MKTIVAHFIKADDQYDSGYVNNNKDRTWQRKMNEKYHGKPRKPGSVLPEDTYTKTPSEIARILKMHSKDYGEASSKLSFYHNSQGRNLQGADKERISQARDALKQAYGVQEDKTTTNALAISLRYLDKSD